MLVTRSELRKLRNKIYVRIISKQNFQNHLKKYSSLTESFIRSSGSSPPEEIADLRSRLELTEKAAAAASTSSSKSADLFLVKKVRQLQDKQQMVSTVPYIFSSMARPLGASHKSEGRQYQSFSMASSNKKEDNNLSQLIAGMDATELDVTSVQPSLESSAASTSSITAGECEQAAVSSDELVPGYLGCCVHSRPQEILVREDKAIANMLLMLQAILVMQFNMSEFVHCKFGSTPPPSRAHSKEAAAQPQSEQTVDWWGELTLLGCVTKNMAYQWVLWLHQAVWLRFLPVITTARNLMRNLVKREKWKQVRDVFTKKHSEN